MAVWHHCRRFFQDRGKEPQQVQELQQSIREAEQTTLEQTIKTISKYTSFLTISHSSLVRKALLGLTDPPARKVILGRGLPAAEGEDLADILLNAGFDVDLIGDWELLDRVTEADALSLGADWVGEKGFINKVGSGELVTKAELLRKPIHIIAEPFKHLTNPPPDESHYYQDWSGGDVQRPVKVFEWVEHEMETQ